MTQPGRPTQPQRPSVPVSLMLMVVGLAMAYVILHRHGWSWHGNVSFNDVWKHLSIPERIAAIVGLILNAWGLGALIDTLMHPKRAN